MIPAAPPPRRVRIARRLLLGAALTAPGLARAFPSRTIRLIVPFPPGGTTDLTARLMLPRFAELIGASVVIENLPGAGGDIGTAAVARAAPDGHTLLLAAPNHTINRALLPATPLDAERDFTPLSLLAQIPEILVCPAAAPFRSFAEFVAHARAHPGALSYSSAGIGSHPHVTMALLLHRLGLEVLHIPYRGAAPALTDLVAGRVQLKLDSLATSAPHIASGAIRVLAYCGRQRSPKLPEVPTVAESGLPGFEGMLWMGIVGPAGLPDEVATQLSQALIATARDTVIVERLNAQAIEPVGSTAAEFRALITREIPQWRELIRAADIRPE